MATDVPGLAATGPKRPEKDAKSRLMQRKETRERRDRGSDGDPPGVGAAKEARLILQCQFDLSLFLD